MSDRYDGVTDLYDLFDRHWQGAAGVSLILFGPLAVTSAFADQLAARSGVVVNVASILAPNAV